MWHVPSNQPTPSRWETAIHWFWTLVTAGIWLMLGSFLWYLDLWRYSMWEWLPRIGAELLKDAESHALIPLIIYLGVSIDAARQRRHGQRIGSPPNLRQNYWIRIGLLLVSAYLFLPAMLYL